MKTARSPRGLPTSASARLARMYCLGAYALLNSASARAQNLASLYESTGFILAFGIAPLVLAVALIVLLAVRPSSRGLAIKVVLAWVIGVVACYYAIDSAYGLLAYVLIVFCPWIGVVALAIALFVSRKRAADVQRIVGLSGQCPRTVDID